VCSQTYKDFYYLMQIRYGIKREKVTENGTSSK